MHAGKTVSIVFPAYNEETGISHAVESFGSADAVDEVIVVDNNSRDRTAELALAAGARVVKEKRQGYGFALRRGMSEAQGDLVILSEPDGTFQASDVSKLLAYAGDAELVLGTRTTRELLWEHANMGRFLRWGNWTVAKLLEVLYSTPSLSDCGCTFRLIHRRALERILPQLTVGASHFLPEMVIVARLAGTSMIEVPVNYRPRTGESKITGNLPTTVTVGLNMLRVILTYRWRGSGQPAAAAPSLRP
jgi:glycosyltransferase involved in cell wall biosynthesis